MDVHHKLILLKKINEIKTELMFLVHFETAYTTPINVKRFSNKGRGKRFQPRVGGALNQKLGQF